MKCHLKSNSFVAAAEQVCLQPVLEHRHQRRGRRSIALRRQNAGTRNHIRATFVRRTCSGLRFTVDAYAKSENPIHSPERVLGQLSTRYWWPPPPPPRDASHYLWSLTTSGSKHASGHSSLRISAPGRTPAPQITTADVRRRSW